MPGDEAMTFIEELAERLTSPEEESASNDKDIFQKLRYQRFIKPIVIISLR